MFREFLGTFEFRVKQISLHNLANIEQSTLKAAFARL